MKSFANGKWAIYISMLYIYSAGFNAAVTSLRHHSVP